MLGATFRPTWPAKDDPDDEEPIPDPTLRERIFLAAVIAGVSAFVASLAEWGAEKIRERFDPPQEETEE
jgi:hypothetical protein